MSVHANGVCGSQQSISFWECGYLPCVPSPSRERSRRACRLADVSSSGVKGALPPHPSGRHPPSVHLARSRGRPGPYVLRIYRAPPKPLVCLLLCCGGTNRAALSLMKAVARTCSRGVTCSESRLFPSRALFFQSRPPRVPACSWPRACVCMLMPGVECVHSSRKWTPRRAAGSALITVPDRVRRRSIGRRSSRLGYANPLASPSFAFFSFFNSSFTSSFPQCIETAGHARAGTYACTKRKRK